MFSIYIYYKFPNSKVAQKLPPKRAKAIYQYTPTGGQLITGSEVTTNASNVGSWRALLGNDSNTNGSSNYWTTARVNPGGLDKQVWFDGVELYGANKMIITIEDSNITTADAYVHQICDWVSSTGVDNPASGNCTGGGWRTLQPRKTSYTNTSDTTRIYEIYNGYFSDRTTSPGTPIDTPLSNFIEPTNKRVLIRAYSTVNSTTQHRWDFAMIEVAIDPIYEPAEFVKDAGGATTGFYSDLIGAVSTNVNASDGNKLTIPMAAANQAIDVTFKFKNVKTYPSMNTILVLPEICVSNTALTFNIYLRNFSSNSWTPLFTTNQTGSACTTDTEYSYAFNDTTVSGFNFSNHISSTGEIWVRFLTNAPATAYNIQFDRIYLMLGSVNTDSTQCEISWGTGTASNCVSTRDVKEAKGAAAATPTWQVTSVLEYPSSFYALDNDDDATNGEAAFSSNLSFPVTIASNTAVTAYHYAVKYRSNNTAITIDLQARNYSGNGANAGGGVGSGWDNTPGTDSNAATTYSWFDTWVLSEQQINPEDYVDTVNNRMNLRLRTVASTATAGGTVWDWDFAMVSIRWVEEDRRIIRISQYTPTGGQLITGSEVTTNASNVGSWRALLGNDSNTNGSSNYWTTARVNPGGLDKQVWFDGVELYGANKMIITIEDSNITTADAYVHQICDWVSSTGVDNPASGNCTGGGWRTLQPRKTSYTNTSDTTRIYEIYNGYFSDRTTSPGTPIDTPLSNFIEPTNKRVLIRAYSTVNSTTQHRWDFAMIEVAIDPIYEPAEFVKDAGGATTGFYSDLIGAVSTNVNASDGNKLTIPMAAANQAIDVTFKFKNVKTYPSMNTILVLPEICVSNTALTFNIYLRNFSSNSWTPLFTTNQTGSACTTDTEYSYAFNDTTVSGFNFSNHISSTGEIWVRFLTNAPATAYNIQFDRIYLMLGSVNTDSTQCEISWGTGTASNCVSTRDVKEAKGAAAATPTWQVTSVLEYPSSFYALDNDDDATNGEAAFSSNLSFPVTIASNTAVTAYHYAVKYRSNNTAITIDLQARNYSGNGANAGGGVGSGWDNTPGTDSNAATTYSWFDTWVLSEQQINPEDYVDTVNNRMNLRLRTVASTATAGGTVWDWDFAMVSIRWIEEPAAPPSLTCTLSATSTDFASLTPSAVSTSSPDITITVTSSGGFQITVKDAGNGTSPGLYKSTSPTYLIQSTDATLTAGTDGYGIQAITSDPNVTINPKYNKSGNNVGGLSLTDIVLASSTSAVSDAKINITHKASASYLAPVGSYSDTITYSCSAL